MPWMIAMQRKIVGDLDRPCSPTMVVPPLLIYARLDKAQVKKPDGITGWRIRSTTKLVYTCN
jgi:hypothetical protein